MSPIIINLITFLVGLLVGNWLAIGRDKRKEFNEANAPIRSWLLKEKDDPNPYSQMPDDKDIDRFVHYLYLWKRGAFLRHLENYKDLHKKHMVQDSYGSCSYAEIADIKAELSILFNYTKHR